MMEWPPGIEVVAIFSECFHKLLFIFVVLRLFLLVLF
jgi:hypothetical protein